MHPKRHPAAATISIAPMVDYSDRHFRFIMRQLSRRALLYTEMIATGALLNGKHQRYLLFNPEEHPVALQVGGDSPHELARCAQMAQDAGFDEINLNVGCPSPRVQKGRFGACLMSTPELVAEIVAEMKAAVKIPVTVKHRIGIKGHESYEQMLHFVDRSASAGCDRFIVHARIAILEGLSPKQNRTVPPLRYDLVHRLKKERPHLAVEINGGFTTTESIDPQLEQVDGVMLGRVAVNNPFLLAQVDHRYYGVGGADPAPLGPTRREVIEGVIPYLARHCAAGGKPYEVLRHLLGLFSGQPGNRVWKRELTEKGNRCPNPVGMLREALERFSPHVLDCTPGSPHD